MKKTISIFLFLTTISFCNCTAQPSFISCGINDIDATRKEVMVSETTPENAKERRASLYRWWRLMWHQGYDMDAFDEVAEMLLNFPNASPQGQQAITAGFTKLEEMIRAGKKTPEISGTKSTNPSTKTNWPLYHGTDATQTGYSPDKGPSTGNIAWKFAKSYGCDISPIIDAGRVYIPGVGDDVIAYCLDEVSGKVIWKGRKYGTQFYGSGGLRNRALLSANNMLVTSGYRSRVFEKKTGKLLSEAELTSKNGSQEKLQLRILKIGNDNFSCLNAQTGKMIKWITSSKNIVGQPVLFNNYFYYITDDGMLNAESLYEDDKKWQKSYQKNLDGSLTANEDGTLYIGTNDGYLLALNASDGDLKWTFNAEQTEPRSQQLFSEVLVKGDRLYLGSANKMVYCLNSNNGKLNWKFRLDDWVRSKPILVDDYIYFATLSGSMYAIQDNSNSAQLMWQNKIAEHGFTSNINGSGSGILGISQNMMLYSVSPKTGKVQWRHGLLDGVFIDDQFYASEELGGQQSSPVVVDGVLYIGGTDGFVNAIDVETGKEKWRFETDGIMASSPTVAFGKVFFGEAYDANGTYYALEKETGLPVWTTKKYGKVWVNATFDDKNIYFGNMDGYFFAVNPDSGKMLWQYNTAKDTPLENVPLTENHRHGFPPGVYSNPVYKNGVVYAGSWAGYYFAFNAESGNLNWRVKTQPDGVEGGVPDSSAPVLYKNHLYVQKGGYQLAAINIETGVIDWLWTAPAGFLQNGTVTAFNNKVYGSIVRSVIDMPYNASIIAFNDVENGGEELWRYEGGGGLTAAVATHDKLIFGSSGDVFITCLNPENGEVKWRTYTGGMMLESVPAIYGNKAFIQSKNGYIYAFE